MVKYPARPDPAARRCYPQAYRSRITRRRRGRQRELASAFALHCRQRPRIDTLGTGDRPRNAAPDGSAPHFYCSYGECTTRLPSRRGASICVQLWRRARRTNHAVAVPQIVNHPRLDTPPRWLFIFVFIQIQ